MNKIETKNWYNGEVYDLIFENDKIKCFANKEKDNIIASDIDGSVLFEISASMSQGCGFMSLTEIKD